MPETTVKESMFFLENAPVAAALFRKGLVQQANARFLRMFGFQSCDEIAGQSMIERIAPQCRGGIRAIMSERRGTLKPGDENEVETIGLRKNSTEFPLYASVTLMELADGPAEMGVFIDITRRKRAEQALKQSEAHLSRERQLLQTIIDTIPVMITIYDPATMHFQVNREVEKVLGWTNEEIQHIDIMEAAYPDVEYRKRNQGLMQSLRPGWHDMTMIAKDGTSIVSNWANKRLPDGRQVGIGLDMRESRRAEDRLRRDEYELRTLVSNSPDLIVRLDRQMRYVYANPAFERVSGIPREQLIGKTNRELGMPEEQMKDWESAVQKVFDSGREESVEFDLASFFGTRYFWGKIIPEFAKDGSVETVMTISRDITERKKAEERIRFISFHDEVTDLFNRAFFEEEIRRLDTERDLPISIIMGDVNNLKLMNDVFGHDNGDMLLKALADVFREACRKDDIVARWGGDEYAVILPKTDHATADSICGRVTQLARSRDRMAITPSISLGTATKETRGQNIYQVIRQAEERMYRNKLDESRRNEDNAYRSLFRHLRERNSGIDGHISRSMSCADAFCRELGLSGSELDDLLLLIRLHDIGEAIIPREILNKPGHLTAPEWELMKKHAEAGFRIVKTFADTARISDDVLSHEERWDGRGYPRGLKSTEIPYLARIFAVIDAYDIMTHPRSYGPALKPQEAIRELRRNAGVQFDPELIEAFVRSLSLEPELSGT
jgi:diguanylate cyclase (GGDEF)-like protein/PAS domain S-box-containing protein